SDVGIGTNADRIRRALDPAAANRDGRSKGRVGLLIAKWLTELHGGKLVFESAKDLGNTASAHLPR
ncbi:MAG TPA: ATP-binding protein, partial [Alphaproteobacteria bacterium]